MEGYSDDEMIEMGRQASLRQAEARREAMFRSSMKTMEQIAMEAQQNNEIASMTLEERVKKCREDFEKSVNNMMYQYLNPGK